MKEFKGKTAVITGGASGIGWGLAERCAIEGMNVVIADVEESALQKAADQLKSRGARVLAVITDVSRIKDIETLAQKSLSAFGGVHLLFNNAGVQAAGSVINPVWENSLADWEWLIGVNLMGTVHGIKVFVPILLNQKTDCHIVNTSSMAGLIADPQLIIYAATKAAIIKLSEGLYLQLKQTHTQIGASVFCPAFVSSHLSQAERNRPDRWQNPGEVTRSSDPDLVKSGKTALQTLTPQQSAEIVFKGIREETFYIFSDALVTRLFKQRADNILAGRNPERPQFNL
jgi:NAD(P)-dependent dehydrogenase (short-subunit alcohol dehydrogenase family)